MPLAEILSLIKGGEQVVKQIPVKKIKELWQIYQDRNRQKPPHFIAPPVAQFPLPTFETSTFTLKPLKPSKDLVRLIRLGFFGGFGLLFLSMPLVMLFADTRWGEFLPAIPATGLVSGGISVGAAIFLSLRRKPQILALGPDGILAKSIQEEWFIARWVDIFEIRPNPPQIELNERTIYLLDWPRSSYKEAARLIRAHVPPEKYAKAEQMVRSWEHLDD